MNRDRSLKARLIKLERENAIELARDLRLLAEFSTEPARLTKLREEDRRHGYDAFLTALTDQELSLVVGGWALRECPQWAECSAEELWKASEEQTDKLIRCKMDCAAFLVHQRAEMDPAGKTCCIYGLDGKICGKPAVARDNWQRWMCAAHAGQGAEATKAEEVS